MSDGAPRYRFHYRTFLQLAGRPGMAAIEAAVTNGRYPTASLEISDGKGHVLFELPVHRAQESRDSLNRLDAIISTATELRNHLLWVIEERDREGQSGGRSAGS